ncbi:MAG: hypothetical protein L6Q57_01910 [Alphaproteobacteria bacterium]|nr:hypothetical protein [Alphaproteobacteria bacterium]
MSHGHDRRRAAKAIENFHPDHYGPHQPDILSISCIDGRERGGGTILNLGREAIRVTEIGAVVPRPDLAEEAFRAKLAFAVGVKAVPSIILRGHTSCGGAQTAIKFPTIEQAPNNDLAEVIASMNLAGIEMPSLRDTFLRASAGDENAAADLLARHLVVVSVDNITRYPSINALIMTDKLDAVPLLHVLNEGTGELSELHRYDVGTMRWYKGKEALQLAHMCTRPDGCRSCQSCHHTIEQSLQPVELRLADGTKIDGMPQHLAIYLDEQTRHNTVVSLPVLGNSYEAAQVEGCSAPTGP